MPGDTSIYMHDYVKPERVSALPERVSGLPERVVSVIGDRDHRDRERDREVRVSRRYVPQKLGNPTPLGLSAFALSVMVISFYNCKAFGVEIPNVAVGVSLFTGGIVQFAAGMWEFKVGNTYGGTGFGAFGGFWGSFGVLYIKGFGIVDAYGSDSDQYNNALAVYCLAWTIFTFIFTLASLRTNMGVLSAFVCLTGVFIALTIFHFTRVQTFATFAGILGIITSSIVWYCFAAVLLTPELSPISLPLWDLSRKNN